VYWRTKKNKKIKIVKAHLVHGLFLL